MLDTMLKEIANTADGVCAIDGQDRIIYWNYSAQALLGYAAEEVQGKRCGEAVYAVDEAGKPLYRPGQSAAASLVRRAPVPHFDVLVRTRSGAWLWINVSTIVVPATEDQQFVIVFLFRDVTRRKQMEQLGEQVLSAAGDLRPRPVTRTGYVALTSLPDLSSLSHRELEILTYLAAGATTSNIATILTISPVTVRNHIQRILDKLRVHSRLEALTYAYAQGLIPPDLVRIQPEGDSLIS